LVAHDDKKDELVAWATLNREKLALHELWGTGTTGGRVIEGAGLSVVRLLSGPLGGDAQLGAMIAEGRLDALIFFQDPLTAMPHDVDIKSLTRLATLYNILFAPNHKTADAVVAQL
ncbi:MAG: methylglyoxal synthase, partial [Devosia sp.]